MFPHACPLYVDIQLTGSLTAFFMYPDIGLLFVVSPIACAGVLIFLSKIKPEDIDHDAARGLTATPTPDGEYNLTGEDGTAALQDNDCNSDNRAVSALSLLSDKTLLTFTIIVFLFHTSNGTVLPLVMQTLAIGEGRSGILMSGLCIIVAQIFMVGSAKVCGDYSGLYGRKTLFLVGLFSVPIRCLILVFLTAIKNGMDETPMLLQVVILSTQILDGVGAGIFGTMYILVTSDVSAGTGRFSLTLGVTTAAMSIGGTVSGYLGQALAQDLGYERAFVILGFMALVPALSYMFFMPETLNYKSEEAATTSVEDRGSTELKEKPAANEERTIV